MTAFEDAIREQNENQVSTTQQPEESFLPTIWGSKEISDFAEELGLRKFNTIPEKVNLKVTFTESELIPDSYEYTDNKGESGTRGTFRATAILEYQEDIAHLVCGIPYALSISKNALIGLMNYLNSKEKNHELKGRTFQVYNKNRKTYIWKELPTERQR